MPSERFANDIRRSLAKGESFEDFAYLFDALILLRRSYSPNLRLSESIAGRLLCVIFPDKPDKYVSAMRGFRLGFSGVSNNRELQAEFSNCVSREAVTLNQPEMIVWRPSLYFSLPPWLKDSSDIKQWWT